MKYQENHHQALWCNSVAPKSSDWTQDPHTDAVPQEKRIATTWYWKRSIVASLTVCEDVHDDSRTRLVRELRLVWFFARVPLWCRRRGIECGRKRAPKLRVVRRWRWCVSDVVFVWGGCRVRTRCRFLRRRNSDLENRRCIQWKMHFEELLSLTVNK